jgi:uncharacterized protein involved in exopolysaccharide biosynthesis
MALEPVTPIPSRTDVRQVAAQVWGERKRIALVSFAAGLLALGAAFLLPNWYRTQATILPPDDTDIFSNISLTQRALSKFPTFGTLGDFFTPADVFKAVLGSRNVEESIIDRFDLQKVYRLKSREKTVKALHSHYAVKLSPEGIISVSVEDRSPQRAADMAMAFLQALDHYNIHNRISRARRTREFLEQRVHETDSLLKVLETGIKVYQEKRHTVVPTSMNSGDVQSSADLMARKISLEVRLGVLRTYLQEDNDEIKSTQTELDQLNQRIATLPALQSDLQRMVRDQKIQEQLFVLLTGELEQARIRETMDTPTVQILDRAYPPERHSRPKRATIAIIATLLTALGTSVWVALRPPRANSD